MELFLLHTPNKKDGFALCRLLKIHGFDFVYCENLEDVLEKIRFGTASLIILDFPSLSSINTTIKDIEQIVPHTEGIQIVMLTPYGMNEKEMKHFQECGYHILEKPVSMDALRIVLDRFFSSSDKNPTE